MPGLKRVKFILVIFFFMHASAQAEFYWGGDVIQSSRWLQLESLMADTPVPAGKFDNTEPGIKFFSGYRASEMFMIEFGVGNLFNGDQFWLRDQNREELATRAFLLSGQSTFNVGESKYLFVRGGLYNWDIKTTDLEFTDDLYVDRQGTDLFYSVGASFDFTRTFGMRAEWERFAVDDEDVDFISTELRFSF